MVAEGIRRMERRPKVGRVGAHALSASQGSSPGGGGAHGKNTDILPTFQDVLGPVQLTILILNSARVPWEAFLTDRILHTEELVQCAKVLSTGKSFIYSFSDVY